MNSHVDVHERRPYHDTQACWHLENVLEHVLDETAETKRGAWIDLGGWAKRLVLEHPLG